MIHKTLITTGVTTHHYFSVYAENWIPILRDPDGKVHVFTNRDRSEDAARLVAGAKATIFTIGMGDEKWAEFQRSEPHRIIK